MARSVLGLFVLRQKAAGFNRDGPFEITMPVTPLHYPLGYAIYRLSGRKLSLPGLITGSFVPDIEIPFLLYATSRWVTSRLVLHSVLGELTIGSIIAFLLTVFLYPKIVSSILGSEVNCGGECSPTLRLLASCALGALSHTILDIFTHDFNPLFWPFITSVSLGSSRLPLMTRMTYATLVLGSLIILVDNRGPKLRERLLIR